MAEREEILETDFRDHGELEGLRKGLRCGHALGDGVFMDGSEARLGR